MICSCVFMYAFMCFHFPSIFSFFPKACQLTPKPSGSELFSLTVALLLCLASIVKPLRTRRVPLVFFCCTYCKIYPWFSEGDSKKKVSSSYQLNSKWKAQMFDSQPPPKLFNSVLMCSARKYKNSIWLSWTQLWWTSRSRCLWNLLAWNTDRIFLDIELKKIRIKVSFLSKK